MSLLGYSENLSEEGFYIASGIKPERNLLAAILARAICDAFGSAQCDKHVRRSAHQWLFGSLTPRKAFSFAWVAHHLDLEPTALQEMLDKYEADDEEALEEQFISMSA